MDGKDDGVFFKPAQAQPFMKPYAETRLDCFLSESCSSLLGSYFSSGVLLAVMRTQTSHFHLFIYGPGCDGDVEFKKVKERMRIKTRQRSRKESVWTGCSRQMGRHIYTCLSRLSCAAQIRVRMLIGSRTPFCLDPVITYVSYAKQHFSLFGRVTDADVLRFVLTCPQRITRAAISSGFPKSRPRYQNRTVLVWSEKVAPWELLRF